VKNFFLTLFAIFFTFGLSPKSAFALDCTTAPTSSECVCIDSNNVVTSQPGTTDSACISTCTALQAPKYQYNKCVNGSRVGGPTTNIADITSCTTNSADFKCKCDVGQYSGADGIVPGVTTEAECRASCNTNWHGFISFECIASPQVNADFVCTCYYADYGGRVVAGPTSESACTAACPGASSSTYTHGVAPTNTLPEQTAAQKREIVIPILNVPIPGLNLAGSVTKEGGTVHSNLIGLYVQAAYRFMLIAGALMAVVMLMVGGLEYVIAGGSSKRIEKAKTRIKNATVGLILLFAAFDLAFLIDPGTVTFSSLDLNSIDAVELVRDSGDVDAPLATSSSGGTNVANVSMEGLRALGITCDGTGDITTVAKSFIGKVTYRFGGGHSSSQPPYTLDDRMCENRACKEFCPTGTACLDCSAFVAAAAECAGLTKISGGTATVLQDKPFVASCTSTSVTTVDGKVIVLEPGDLLGFRSGDFKKEPKNGHIVMYIGPGQIIHSASKRSPGGNAVTTESLSWLCKSYAGALRVIDRNP